MGESLKTLPPPSSSSPFSLSPSFDVLRPAKPASIVLTTGSHHKLMRSGVDHEVHSQPVRLPRVLFGITVLIHVLPGVSQIGIVGGHHHKASFVIGDSIDPGFGIV